MEKMKEKIESKLKVKGADQEMKDQSSSDNDESEDEDIPEFIDWRAKKSHK